MMVAKKVDQRVLHSSAIKHLSELQSIIDHLKSLGPHERDGDNALINVRERLQGLSRR